MPFSVPTPLLATAVVSGVFSHLLLLRCYELDAHVLLILLNAGLVFLVKVSLLSASYGWVNAWKLAFAFDIIYYTTIALSVTVYRLFFHPLKRYPGPFLARWSMWWKVMKIAQQGPHFSVIDRLHKEYGDVVRVGPNHLSINRIEALSAIYGRHSPCTKPPSYLIGGLHSLQSERDHARHAARRAVWDKALGSKASNTFLPKLEAIANLLVEKLKKQNGCPVKVNDWVHYFTFDTMGEFALGSNYGQLQSEKLHEGVEYAAKYLKYAIYGVQVPWLAYLLSKVPYLLEPQAPMMQFARKCLEKRILNTPEVPDALSYVLASNNDPSGRLHLSTHELESDVFLVQIAGSDTSYSVLMDLLFWFAARPTYQHKVRNEIGNSATHMSKNPLSWPTIASASFFDALIRETMRFHPPVSSGLGRLTPLVTGLRILSEDCSTSPLLIPPDVVVSVPTYNLHHDHRYFADPDSFEPLRWTTRPEMVKDHRAFCAFSKGAYGCAGKYFAYMEIKILVAKILTNFDVQFDTKNFDSAAQKAWLDGHQDHMTLQAPTLKLRFVTRKY